MGGMELLVIRYQLISILTIVPIDLKQEANTHVPW